MSSLNDSWLDFLVKHSIFELNDSELKHSERIKSKQTRQDNTIVNFVLQHHCRVLSIRDNDLFVAVGSQIRVLNLTNFKDTWMNFSQEADKKGVELSESWIHTVHYKILETPEINFAIECMTPNKNGRLLAVTGEKQLVIVCLPRQGFASISSDLSRKKIDCRTLSVGTKYYDINKNSILKIEWHPLSETRTHVIILGNDNMLRMFDVSTDIDQPEQSFDLSPAEQKTPQQSHTVKNGFSVDEDNDSDEDVVTFSLGGASKDRSGWECFTVFYALRSGHIYALCPIIPYRSIVRRNHLDNLLYISEAKYEQAKSASVAEHKTLSHLFSLHSSWINALFKSARIARKTIASDNDSLVVSSDAQHNLYPVRRQGPFLINHTQLLNNGIEVVDLLLLNIEPVSCLVVALNNGTLHNFILGSEIDAQWQMPVNDAKSKWQKELAILLTDSEFLPKASLYETIDLKSQQDPKFQTITLVSDPLYEDIYFAYHAGGVHAVSMAKWVKTLCDISIKYESGQDMEAKRKLDSWLKEKKSSEVRQLVNSSPFKEGFLPIVGLVIITDVYLSYSMLALTSDYRLVKRDLNMRRENVLSEVSQNAVKAQLKEIGAEESDENGYQALLPLPAFVPPPQLDSLPKQAKVVIPADMNGSKEIVVNEETLRFFANASEKIRREAHDIKKTASKIDNRLTLQQKEFERQLDTVRELYDRLQKVTSETAKTEQQQKLRDVVQKHNKLRLRIDEQLRTLMRNYQPELSKEEEGWIEKLEKLSKKVSGESGYVERINMLQEQLKQIEVQAIKTNKPNTSNMNPVQLKNILRTLNDQSLTIDDITERIKHLESKLSTTVA
ncbi:MAG: nuclear pore component-domain-containing protein [Benjaminiella poitrasii]|nr:MAG: nuclear pore component-domain-containing protein [Benjaminiella poitrasii]